MKENQDFWGTIPMDNEGSPARKWLLDEGPTGFREKSYEKTSENEYNPNYQYIEMEFETTFSFAYDNCPKSRITRTKIICTTTSTIDKGIEDVKIKLLKSYPNLSINSIIHQGE